jgi:hypothetical protein
MQPITQNPYALERWSAIKVNFQLIDTDAAEDATATVTSEAAISKLSQTHNRAIYMSNKLATLEPDYFLLDGSFLLPDEADNGEVGWWSSEISDINGNLNQVLEFNFIQDHSSVGFTIVFDDRANEYASDFTIQAYDSLNNLLDEDIVTGNTLHTYISEMPVENYRRVKITFTKTSKPFRRIRVCEVSFGIVRNFDGDNTKDLNLLYEISQNAENLPSHELNFTIDNSDKKYNMINPDSVYKYLQQGQQIDAYLGVGSSKEAIEYINMGKFYYTTSKAEDDSLTAQITGNDLFYTLNNSICRIGSTGTWTVNDAVNAVILDSGLNITVNIPSIIGIRTINKCIPKNTTHREVLRLIAQAAMCTCYFNRLDELVFAEITEGTVVDTLNNSNMYKPAKISDLGRVNKIELVVYNEYSQVENIYTASNKEVGETDKVKTVNNPLAYNGQAVANWLLAMAQMRIKYELQERGNPAREITDTVKIYDAYNENRNAVITKEEFNFDGTLRANTVARGGL